MTKVICFGEDLGHERIISTILDRVAADEGVAITPLWRIARRGHGAVVNELKSLLRDIRRAEGEFPNLIIVATDANCKGFNTRRAEITDLTDKVPGVRVACAIPDPHIERWLLVDSAAFKSVLGVGCQAPDQKCERDRYKRALREAVRQAGISPALGGIEYAEDIINAMDLDRAGRAEPSLGHFLTALRANVRSWRP